jgi:hypothetical protein
MMSDSQKKLLVRLSTLQAELDSLKADIKQTEKQEKDNANSD